MSNRFEVVSVNISDQKGTTKRPVGRARIDANGVAGDAHAGHWHRQVSVLGQDSIDRFAAEAKRAIAPGEFAENLTVKGLDLREVAVQDRFRIGDVDLEVSQIGKECHGESCAIFREVGRCVMPREGIFCRVLHGGEVGAGDAGDYEQRTLDIRIVTLSDRASQGVYEDRSGPRARVLVEDFARSRRWRVRIGTAVLPDDAARLRTELDRARSAGADIVLTTGGTGVGPRDVTPEAVTAACDKLIPGLMEGIRGKYGASNPKALLSRAVAGVAGKTLVFTMPGSVHAVEEYLKELFAVLEHLMLMIRGIDAH